MSFRGRFAPSPTGLPHVGTLRNALYSWLLARHKRRHDLQRIQAHHLLEAGRHLVDGG